MGWAARNPQIGTNIGQALGAIIAGVQNESNQRRAEADRRELAGALAEYHQAAAIEDQDPETFAAGLSRLYAERGLEPGREFDAAVKMRGAAWTRGREERQRAQFANAVPDLFGEPEETDYLLRGGAVLTPRERLVEVRPADPFGLNAQGLADGGLGAVTVPLKTEWYTAEGVTPLSASARAAERFTGDGSRRERYGRGLAGLVRQGAVSPEKVLDFARALEADETKDANAELLAEGRALAAQNRGAIETMRSEERRDLAGERIDFLRTQLDQRLTELGRKLESAEEVARMRGESAESVAKLRGEAQAEAAKLRADASAEIARMRADASLEAARIRAAATEDAARMRRDASDARADRRDARADARSEMGLRQEFEKLPEVKVYTEVTTRYPQLEAAVLQAERAGNKAMADQALITLFNKTLDPTSVVRESEYARTPEYLPWANRIAGKIAAIKQGGPGLTAQDRREILATGKALVESSRRDYETRASEYRSLATDYGFNPDRVVTRGRARQGKPPPPAPSPNRGPVVQKWEKGPDGKPRRVR